LPQILSDAVRTPVLVPKQATIVVAPKQATIVVATKQLNRRSAFENRRMGTGLEAPFFIWLEAHPTLVQFIHIDTCDAHNSPSKGVPFGVYRQQVHERACLDLTSFQEEKLKPFPPAVTSITRPLRDDRRLKLEMRSLSHTVSWLEYKIFRLRTKHFRLSIQMLEDLLSILRSNFSPPTYLLVIDTDALKAMILTEPPELVRIKHSFLFLYKNLKDSQRSCPAPDQQKKRIKQLINEALKTVDAEIAFFPPSPVQQQFDRLLLLPNSCCYQKLHGLISSFQTTAPEDFMNGLIDVSESLAQMFEIRDTAQFAVIVTLLIRTVFDEVYPTIEMFQNDRSYPDVLKVLRQINVRELQPPLEYAPPMSDDDLPGLIFREDPQFRKVIDQLELLVFYTNPLDIIHQLHLALKDLERAADAHLREGVELALMLPFDVTFGLLLCSLAGAVIPEYQRVAEFTIKYAPNGKLCPAFELALTKIRATMAHLAGMVEEG
jgi:hypothetical protein